MRLTIHLRVGLSLLLALTLLLPLPPAPANPGQVQAAEDKIDRDLQRQIAANPNKKLPIIVEMARSKGPTPRGSNERRAREAADRLGKSGVEASRVRALALIGGAAGIADAGMIGALSRDPSVAFIHEDSIVKAQHGNRDESPARVLGAAYPFQIGANRVWLDGTTGAGVGVAVFDSGIAPRNDLFNPSKRLVAVVNFAGDMGGMPDPGGHGTHMAGIIAGNGTRGSLDERRVQPASPAAATPPDYVGVAPGARLIDVRVLDSNGNGRISWVLAGIQWVLNNKGEYNIRVINLSLGAPMKASYRVDPLSAAVEIAWKRGIVVVTAAGNGGPDRGTVQTPGVDPYVITVGAADDQDTPPVLDDTLATFSSWGTPRDSTPKPDLIAPGRQIVSLRAPGSYLDRLYPDRVVPGRSGDDYFRLSGTSMSAAIVSGVVALMLEARPRLSPDQVKALLVGTTQPYGQSSSTPIPDPAADGSGLVDAYAAIKSPLLGEANRGLRPADGFARAIYPLLYGQPLVWKDPKYAGIDWTRLNWDNLAWDNLAWDNLAWDNLAWDNLAWDNLAWDNLAWDNLAWDGSAWNNLPRD